MVRRIRRTVKQSVNRSSCTCERKVCFFRVVVCVVCTFSVLEGLPEIGKLQNATMCSFDTGNPGSLVFEVHCLMLERTEILMVQMDGRGCRCT